MPGRSSFSTNVCNCEIRLKSNGLLGWSRQSAASDVRGRGAKFRRQPTRWSGSVPAAPAILPRDAEGLEVMLAMRVVAADAVEFHGLITVHRQHERRAEANALLFNVAFDLIDRGASASEITSVQR